jgi:HAMP domain-containing protein
VAQATDEVRRAATEPIRLGDQPWWLVPRMARVQGLIALASGDRRLAGARFTEALAAWRRYERPASAEELAANFLDLGRPAIVGLVEPQREIDRLEAELAGVSSFSD